MVEYRHQHDYHLADGIALPERTHKRSAHSNFSGQTLYSNYRRLGADSRARVMRQMAAFSWCTFGAPMVHAAVAELKSHSQRVLRVAECKCCFSSCFCTSAELSASAMMEEDGDGSRFPASRYGQLLDTASAARSAMENTASFDISMPEQAREAVEIWSTYRRQPRVQQMLLERMLELI